MLMDDVLDDLVRAARRCARASKRLERDTVLDGLPVRLAAAIGAMGRAWSGSWIGYHSRVYTEGLRDRRPGESFDSEWGAGGGFASTMRGEWAEYDVDTVRKATLAEANVSDEEWRELASIAHEVGDTFDDVKGDVLPTLDAVLATHADNTIQGIRADIASLKSHNSQRSFVMALAPKQYMSRDGRAMNEGLQVPAHVQLQVELAEHLSYGMQIDELGKQIRHVTKYLEKRHKMKGRSVARTDGKIFIGHGRSHVWRDLKDFVQDRLNLSWDEFNREPTAGMSSKERLLEMLDGASFAFLVMTAEDEQADGTRHARSNVIHEVGLFQGRLGFERAIVLLEEGCEEFSNIIGVTQIRFPSGNVKAQFEDIRRVLEREGILHP
ncbi:MAG: TIR domain-containing protein [Polyangiaceae bacterium]